MSTTCWMSCLCKFSWILVVIFLSTAEQFSPARCASVRRCFESAPPMFCFWGTRFPTLCFFVSGCWHNDGRMMARPSRKFDQRASGVSAVGGTLLMCSCLAEMS